MLYANIILDIKNAQVDRIFDYEIPASLASSIQIGVRVIVPFGFKNTRTEGYVLGITDNTDIPLEKIKPILDVLDYGTPLFSIEMIQLAQWMKETYFCTLNQCLQTIMPAGIKTKNVWSALLHTPLPNRSRTKQEELILHFLQQQGGSAYVSKLQKILPEDDKTTLNSLVQHGDIHLIQETSQKEHSRKVLFAKLSEDIQAINLLQEKLKQKPHLFAQYKVLQYLSDCKEAPLKQIQEALEISDSPIRSLAKQNAVVLYQKEVLRDVFDTSSLTETLPFSPTPEQHHALEQIKAEWKKTDKKPILLHGITGSGKTEVYLQMTEEVLRYGKQAIILVPEIALTSMIVKHFVSRFKDKVSVTHSRMTYGERLDQWKKAKNNEISIMIGPRSALFTPFSNLGIVIIDEEHETSYRSDTTPKYDAKEVAEKLCQLTDSLLVLGSATPDIPTYHRAMQGEIKLLSMKHRTNHSTLPQMTIVDMRQELEKGNLSIFSKELYDGIKENLKAKQQTILFLNRRGYSSFVSCRKCGHVMTCDNCSVSYTYHANSQELICHYCGKRIANPSVCPACGSKYIKYFGIGTQKIEEETKRLFPQAVVLRMDMDTTTKKNSHQQILQHFASGKADILIGTQMIAKGHDFPNVTLVGIMAADISLNIGSYTASEINYQLITQAAGRAGRGNLSGKVVIQTYHPEHYSIVLAAEQNYHGFYEQECKFLRSMEYPPFGHVFSILLTSAEENDVIHSAEVLADIIKKQNLAYPSIVMLGPSPAAISKLKNEYRWNILLKGKNKQELKQLALKSIEEFKKTRPKVQWNLTLNPR
ncbi:MAG: primosomal protein N' [Epulopiscium sp.]|nr:primosomal protein N' [Candidatus Epulonipiscium sp.]